MTATPEDQQHQQELAAFYRDASDYDLIYASLTSYDLPFWQTLLTQHPYRRVLELGCGTGRLTIPLARLGLARGFTIAGLDRTESMLARARQKWAAEPPAVQSILRFHQGDMRAWSLDGPPFDFIFMPFNVAMHLSSLDDQLAAWRCAAAHLAPGGRFAVDVFLPATRQLLDGVYHPPADEHRAPDGARLTNQSETRHYDASAQTQHIERTTIYTFDGHARPDRETHIAIDIHIYFPNELRLLFLCTGFEIEASYGDYHLQPFGPGTSRQILIGTRTDKRQ